MKNETYTEIQSLNKEEEKDMKDISEKKRGFADSVLKELSKEINEYIISFEKKGNEASQKIEDKYQNYKYSIILPFKNLQTEYL